MKKFYLHDGVGQKGPFTLIEIKSKNLNKKTPIWYEGLANWTTADQVDELKDVFLNVMPPPFIPVDLANLSSSPQSQILSESIYGQTIKKKKNIIGTILQIIGAVLVIAIIIMVINSYNGEPTKDADQTYQEKVMTVEEIEQSQPAKFLSASGTYDENFWGDKFKIKGIIENNATVASYKDAIIRVIYYSKTKTQLGSQEYTIYDNFPPHSKIQFELKVEKFKDVDKIGWEVLQATAIIY